MTDPHDVRRRANEARRLLDDEALGAVLHEIEAEACSLFLASGGNPETMTAAYRKVEAVSTLRAALKTRLSDQAFADKREQTRGRHD